MRVRADLQVQRRLQLLAARAQLRALRLQLAHLQVQVPNDLGQLCEDNLGVMAVNKMRKRTGLDKWLTSWSEAACLRRAFAPAISALISVSAALSFSIIKSRTDSAFCRVRE